MRYAIYTWFMNNVVGKLLVWGYKQDIKRGNTHHADHIRAVVDTGNSQKCTDEHCTLQDLIVRPERVAPSLSQIPDVTPHPETSTKASTPSFFDIHDKGSDTHRGY